MVKELNKVLFSNEKTLLCVIIKYYGSVYIFFNSAKCAVNENKIRNKKERDNPVKPILDGSHLVHSKYNFIFYW